MKRSIGVAAAAALGAAALGACNAVLGADGFQRGVCDEGARQCAGDTPQACAAGQWQDTAPCGPRERCSAGACACEEGARRCAGGNAPEACESGKWMTLAACVGQTCQKEPGADQGSCAGQCVALERRCVGSVPETCSAAGQWESAAPCAAPTHCQGGECVVSCAAGVDVQCFDNTPQKCDMNGLWQPEPPCAGQTCKAGACQGECPPGGVRCSGNVRQTCDENGAWVDRETCEGPCNHGLCPVPSCAGLGTCGPKGNEHCCLSPIVTGGTYSRINDPSYPATVSDFRLDRFEVTVGRFRRFVDAYPASKPKPGDGAPSPDKLERGWQKAWDVWLPADQDAMRALLHDDPNGCDFTTSTWTAAPAGRESSAMNCVSWYLAFAFCAWDKGRLPTEAEWGYAAAGGAEQRAYPWSNPPASVKIDDSYAVYNSSEDVAIVESILRPGSRSPAGDGKWGQADLAGNLWEWTLDVWADPYIEKDCHDCAHLDPAPTRVIRGGGFNYDGAVLLNVVRSDSAPGGGYWPYGFRCARSP